MKDRERCFFLSPDISDSFSELLYRHHFLRFYLSGHYGRVFYLRVWEKGIHKIVAGGGTYILYLIRSLKKVSVLSVNLQSHTTASTHCMVKKRRREGLYSFDLRNALDILMPHHFMGRVFQRGGHNRNPPSGISSRREESAGPYDSLANGISSRAPGGCRPNRSSGSERRRRRPPVAGCIS